MIIASTEELYLKILFMESAKDFFLLFKLSSLE